MKPVIPNLIWNLVFYEATAIDTKYKKVVKYETLDSVSEHGMTIGKKLRLKNTSNL